MRFGANLRVRKFTCLRLAVILWTEMATTKNHPKLEDLRLHYIVHTTSPESQSEEDDGEAKIKIYLLLPKKKKKNRERERERIGVCSGANLQSRSVSRPRF